MAENSGIQWTDHTFNAWVGCEKVSAACKNCYAEISPPARTSRKGGIELWGSAATTARKKSSDANWALPVRWNRVSERAGVQALVFCSSLADVFEDHPSVGPWRTELFALIERTPWLIWQLLSKRPENMRRMLPAAWLEHPLPNVWLGTTVEDQASADERIPHLLGVPAELRFLSCEPLLGPVDLAEWIAPMSLCGRCGEEHDGCIAGNCPSCDTDNLVTVWGAAQAERLRSGARYNPENLEGAADVRGEGSRIHWVIVGGESGNRARPFDLSWAYGMIDQCRAANLPVFVKQLGARPKGSTRCRAPRNWLPSDRIGSRDEWVLSDSHGGDPSEWPSDLRVREMPGGAK